MRSLSAKQASSDADAFLARLNVALENLRERAKQLGGEIARDHPDFPAHDVSHSDALWGLADQIAGPDLVLTPTEAFVFGASALIHDLGMASAAYVEGTGSIEEDPRWADRVAFLRRQRERQRADVSLDDQDVKKTARGELLRELHAEHAEGLATAHWTSPEGTRHTLIEDSELRAALGPTIGLVAHSHWWSPTVLAERFSEKLGSPAGAPVDWTIRPMLIACLLRLADASHLDSSRAPRFLRLLRQPDQKASPHWEFQAKLSQPYPHGDRFVFSGSPFEISEADAWWLCADMLQSVDREMRSVDALLSDRGEERFSIRGVVGVDDLGRLAEHLPTEGWVPADAQVRVSDVVRLVERLGGRELYGSIPHVPLRELLQNGSDAVRARRAIENRPPDWGEVVVRIGNPNTDGERAIEVEDTGVGMSATVLSNHLLDFGKSFWESERVLTELPNLLATGFEPTGRFGIGFFSIFMWGDHVAVFSRRHDSGQTNVLEFGDGLKGRPLLRTASDSEQLRDPGTRIQVSLNRDLLWTLGIDERQPAIPAISQLCAWIAPALDVTLRVEAPDEDAQVAVVAGDWQHMSMDRLAERIAANPLRSGSPPESESLEMEEDAEPEDGSSVDDSSAIYDEVDGLDLAAVQQAAAELREHDQLIDLEDGTVVGRICINPFDHGGGVVTVGGFRSATMADLDGILLGDPTTASRHFGVPIARKEVLAEWAQQQTELAANVLTGSAASTAAEIAHACGADTGPLPIGQTADGALNRDALVRWVADREEILALHNAALWIEVNSHGRLDLADDLVAVGMTTYSLLRLDEALGRVGMVGHTWPPQRLEANGELVQSGSLFELVLEAAAEAWNLPRTDLFRRVEAFELRVIGTRAGAEIKEYVHPVRRELG